MADKPLNDPRESAEIPRAYLQTQRKASGGRKRPVRSLIRSIG